MMKKILVFAALMLVVVAPATLAAGISLGWNDCIQGSGAANADGLCTSTSGAPYTMVQSLENPPALSQFISATTVMRVATDQATLPDWWRCDAAGCRTGRLLVDGNSFAGTGPFNCTDPWEGGSGGGGNFIPGPYVDDGTALGADFGVIQAVLARPTPFDMNPANGEHYLMKVQILKTASTACAGCTFPACIYFRLAILEQPAGVGNVSVTTGGTRNYVTWNGGGTINCPGYTPNHKSTWGSVKALYR